MIQRVPLSVVLIAAVLAAGSGACHRRPVVIAPETLGREVTIRRDTFGIPHILADSEEAAAFAFGYAQAEDHALEIVRRMIAGRGESAKYFGDAGVESDFNMLRFDNIGEATRGLSVISPLFNRIVTSYVAGVNRYLEQHKAELPAWALPIAPADVLANSRAGAVNELGGNTLQQRLRAKYSSSNSTSRVSDTPLDEGPGSNAFALAGSRTTTGKPILLGNPHLNWSSLYWEAHVRVPGRIDFYGSTLVGIPVLRAGFNDRLGFVTTNNAPDLDDVYALEEDGEHPDHYILDGQSIALSRRDVTIQIRSGDGALRSATRTYWNTSIGPVIYRIPGRIFTIKSSRLQAHRYFEGFYELSKARTLDEWMAALRNNLVPTSNFTYADADGNILYHWNGQVPVRADANADYSLDVPARSMRDVWSRFHPVNDLPHLLNPRGGYVQNANNPPSFVSVRDPLDMSGFPRYFERGPLALRPQLALELLESQSTFSVADVIRAKYDTRMLLASRVVPSLLEAVRSSGDAPPLARIGADVLAAWDGHVSVSSRGAVLFQRFWDAYVRRVRQPFARPWDSSDALHTPSGLADPGAAVQELATAVRETRDTYGSESIAWGDANRFRIGSVNLPGDGASGTYGCYRVIRFDAQPGGAKLPSVAGNLESGSPLTGFGDAWILLVDFAPPVTGWSVLAYGQTSDLASPHSRDQLGVFAGHDLRRAWYTESEIMGHLERAYRPQ